MAQAASRPQYSLAQPTRTGRITGLSSRKSLKTCGLISVDSLVAPGSDDVKGMVSGSVPAVLSLDSRPAWFKSDGFRVTLTDPHRSRFERVHAGRSCPARGLSSARNA